MYIYIYIHIPYIYTKTFTYTTHNVTYTLPKILPKMDTRLKVGIQKESHIGGPLQRPSGGSGPDIIMGMEW